MRMMGNEIELAFYNVDRNDLARQLDNLGAKFIGKFHFRRMNFQVKMKGESNSENYETSWIRVRTNGESTTLTLKEQKGKDSAGRKEFEVTVSDFDETAKILSRLFKGADYDYFENDREIYELGDIEFCIDKFPKLPYLFEIEGKTKEEVDLVAQKLKIGGEIDGKKSVPTSEYYKQHGMDYAIVQEEYQKIVQSFFDE